MDEIGTSSESNVQVVAGKILLWIFFLLIIGTLGFTYWKFMVARNYVVVVQAECDPYSEKCFTHVCDPDPNMDGECTGDLVEDTWQTKNISRMAYNMPECNPATDEACALLLCKEGEEKCFYDLCDESNVPEGDTCNDPVEYTKNNPVEEEVMDLEVEPTDEAMACDVTIDPTCVTSDATTETPATDCNSADSQACSIPVIPTAVPEAQ